MTEYVRNTLTGDLAPVNAELEKIQNSLASKFDRIPSTGQPNQLRSTLDANSQRVINLPKPVDNNDAVRLQDIRDNLWITADSVVVKETFEELEAYESPQSFNYFVCIERNNAFYVLQDEGYVADTGDIEFSNGRVAKLTIFDVVYPEYFGVISGDSTSKLQAAIDRATSEGGRAVKLSKKTYSFSSLTISGGVTIEGTGSSTSDSLLMTTNTTTDKITVTSNQQVAFKNLYMGSLGGAVQTGGSYINYTASSGFSFAPYLESVTLAKPYIGVTFTTASRIKMQNCYVTSAVLRSVYIENTADNDQGDHYLAGNTFDAGAEPNTIHLFQRNSGGLKLIGNKFLAGAYHYNGSFSQTGAGATATSVLCINGNSFENSTVACIRLTGNTPNSFGLWEITGNEIKTAATPDCRAIQIPDNTYDHVKNGVISSNIIIHNGTNGTGIEILRGSNILIGPNAFVTNTTSGTTGIRIGANAVDIDIERQEFNNTGTDYSINASATGIRLNEPEYDLGNHVTAQCSSAVGNVYESPVTSVSFNKTHPVAPRVHTQLVASGGSTFGIAVSNISTTGFDFKATGAQLNDAVTLLWHTSLE